MIPLKHQCYVLISWPNFEIMAKIIQIFLFSRMDNRQKYMIPIFWENLRKLFFILLLYLPPVIGHHMQVWGKVWITSHMDPCAFFPCCASWSTVHSIPVLLCESSSITISFLFDLFSAFFFVIVTENVGGLRGKKSGMRVSVTKKPVRYTISTTTKT